MTVDEAIYEWEWARQLNNASIKRLHDAGQRQLALECTQENKLIERFLETLKNSKNHHHRH
jgi:hypothetical protein